MSNAILVSPARKTTAPPSKSYHPTESYNGTQHVFRILRCSGWGPELLNLGYYSFRGRLAAFWNALWSLAGAQKRLVRKAAEFLQIQPGERVLDIASGRGGSAFVMKCMVPQATICGVDLLPEHLELATRLYAGEPGLEFRQGDAQNLPFEDESFERIMCCEAAFHFSDRPKFVSEAARVLKPGGRFVIVDFVWKSKAAREQGFDSQSQIVRDAWQWEDLALPDEYVIAGQTAKLQLERRIDWSKNVTNPLQELLELNTFMINHRWTRPLLFALFPQMALFSTAEAEHMKAVAASHRYTQNLCQYEVFVFTKPTKTKA